jgi:hypothetical protein
MSFSSVKSQQFGRVVNYDVSGSGNATIGEVLFDNKGEGSFIYSLSLIVTISGTTFGTSEIKIGTNIFTSSEKIINVLKCDVTGSNYYTYNMSGVAVDDFEIYLYATSHTSPYSQAVSWVGLLQVIKVV